MILEPVWNSSRDYREKGSTMEPFTMVLGAGILIGAAWPWIVAGGSVLAIPVLIAMIGLKHPRAAEGTSLVAVSVIASMGVIMGTWQRTIHWLLALEFTIPALAGLELERVLGYGLPLRIRLIVLGCLLLLTVSLMISLPDFRESWMSKDQKRMASLVPKGFVVGILGGWIGLGGGLLVMPTLLLSGVPFVAATGSAFVSIASLGMANALPYAVSNTIHWKILGAFLCGVVMGGATSLALIRKIGQPPTLSRMMMGGLAVISLIIIGVNVHSLYT